MREKLWIRALVWIFRSLVHATARSRRRESARRSERRSHAHGSTETRSKTEANRRQGHLISDEDGRAVGVRTMAPPEVLLIEATFFEVRARRDPVHTVDSAAVTRNGCVLALEWRRPCTRSF